MAVFVRGKCECGKRKRLPSKKAIKCECGGKIEPASKWTISYYDGAIERTESFVNQEIAKEAERKRLTNVSEGRADLNRVISTPFLDALEKFKAFLSVLVTGKKLSAGTKEFYLKNLDNHVAPIFKRFTLDRIDLAAINGMVTTLQRKDNGRGGLLSTTTIDHCTTALQRLMTWSEGQGLVRHTPFTIKHLNKEIIRFGKVVKTRALSRDEIAVVLSACKTNKKLYLIVMIALMTGLRRSDVVSLRWDEIFFESGVIGRKRIAKTKLKDGEKSWKPVNKEIIELLQARKTKSRSNLFVFPMRDNPNLPHRDKSRFGFERVRDELVASGRIKEHFTFHDLRRSFATICAQEGIPLESTQEMLNHSDIRITREIYTQVEREKLMKDFQGFKL